MSELLERPLLPDLPPGEPRWTFELADALVEREPPVSRVEVLDGELIVSPAPFLPHQRMVIEIYHQLDDARPPGWEVFPVPLAVVFPEGDALEPDLVASPADFADRGLFVAPALVVEVLSPSRHRYDKVRKRAAYARRGVPSYWIGDPAARTVTVLELGDGSYAEVGVATPASPLAVVAPYALEITVAAPA